MLTRKFVAFGAESRDDAFGVDQRFRTAERDKTDLRRGSVGFLSGILHAGKELPTAAGNSNLRICLLYPLVGLPLCDATQHPTGHNSNPGGPSGSSHTGPKGYWRSDTGSSIVAVMKQILFGLFLVGILTTAGFALAAEEKVLPWRYNAHSPDLPFPRLKRAESVWASGHCWSECGSFCA